MADRTRPESMVDRDAREVRGDAKDQQPRKGGHYDVVQGERERGSGQGAWNELDHRMPAPVDLPAESGLTVGGDERALQSAGGQGRGSIDDAVGDNRDLQQASGSTRTGQGDQKTLGDADRGMGMADHGAHFETTSGGSRAAGHTDPGPRSNRDAVGKANVSSTPEGQQRDAAVDRTAQKPGGGPDGLGNTSPRGRKDAG